MEIHTKFELTSYEMKIFKPNLAGEYLTMATLFLDTNGSIKLDTVHERLIKSLEYLQKRHLFLRSHLEIDHELDKIFIVGDDHSYQLPDIDLIDVTWQPTPSRESLVNICAEFNTKLFDFERRKNELLWRVQVIFYQEEAKLKLIVNLVLANAISDGLSITSTCVELVNVFNALSTNTTCREMGEIVEPCESIHYYFEKNGLFNKVHQMNAKMIKSKTGSFKLEEKFVSTENGFHLNLFKFDKETSGRIISTSKSFQVRLTAYLYTTLLYAMDKLYKENGLTLPNEIGIEFPMNLRLRFQPNIPLSSGRLMITFGETFLDDEYFGSFVDFWKDAKYFQTKVDECSSGETGAVFADIYTSSQSIDQELQRDVSSSECNVCFSNLGSFVSNSVEVLPGPIEITELYCSDSLQLYPNKGICLLGHANFWNGEIMIQFGANKRYFGPRYCDRFVELFKKTVHEML